jgi:hypothetical protein
MRVTIAILILSLFAATASAKPGKMNVVLITYQVIEDNAPVACDAGAKLDIDGKSYDIECNGSIDEIGAGLGGTFLVRLKPGKHSFRIWNVSEPEAAFDRSISKRPSWFVQNITIEVVNGNATVTSSNL